MNRASPELKRVADGGHPRYSLPLAMERRLSRVVVAMLVIVAGLAGNTWAWANEKVEGYRLAGLLAVGNDYVAILELPDGDQVLVRDGTEIPEHRARVGRVQADGLVLMLDDEGLVLVLDDSGRAPEIPSALGVVTEASDSPGVR